MMHNISDWILKENSGPFTNITHLLEAKENCSKGESREFFMRTALSLPLALISMKVGTIGQVFKILRSSQSVTKCF